MTPERRLALAQLANSIGDGAFYACSALFFTRMVGLSATAVGLALTVGWATGMVAGTPLGHLADRFGARRIAIGAAVLTSAVLVAFLVVRAYPLFVPVFCLYACCQAASGSARQALLAALVPAPRRVAARAKMQSTSNAGLALGAGLGGVALAIDTAPAYLGTFALDAICFLIAATVLRGLPEIARTKTSRVPRSGVLRDPRYTLLTFLNGILCLNMPVLSLGLPLWIAERTDAPRPMAAALLMVNMLAVVFFQMRVARRVTDQRGAVRACARAGVLMLVACAVYAMSGGHRGLWLAIGILLLGAVLQVCGEMHQGAAGWELSFGLAPADRQGQYQGFFGMGPQFARTLGPVLMTTLLLRWGTPGWLLLGGLFLAAGLAMRFVVRPSTSTPASAPAGTSTPASAGSSTPGSAPARSSVHASTPTAGRSVRPISVRIEASRPAMAKMPIGV